MKKLIFLVIILFLMLQPVSATEFAAPEVPESAEKYMPEDTESFGEGLWYIIKVAISQLHPSIAEALAVCLSLMAVMILTSVLHSFPSVTKHLLSFAGTVSIGIILIQPANAMIQLGTSTVHELNEYGKLLLPVMTAAMAAQGGVTSSAALYAGTMFFDSILSALIVNVIIPMLYVYLCLCIAKGALSQEMIKNLRNTVKWFITWSLKTILYVFTGYISITGVISGTADAAAIKAAKLTISGAVPIVGGILSDASETILVSAGVMKSAAGVYGLLAIAALWIGPFLQIGIQYLMLKVTAAVCSVIGPEQSVDLIQDFSGAMGMILAMIGTVCLLLLISTVCLMKGVS